jgi:hypothetical protein
MELVYVYDEGRMSINVLEMRNYLLKPGQRDRFNNYFTKHFIESQAVRGGHVLGKFAVDNEPDNFVWVRGFEDMAARSAFLPDFYRGPAWKEFGPEANEMMIDSDNVHLLKPLDALQVFTPGKAVRVDYYFAKDTTPDNLIDIFAGEHSNNTSLWISELAENDFPALPVFQYGNLLVAIGGDDINPELQVKLEPLITKKESLLLYEI